MLFLVEIYGFMLRISDGVDKPCSAVDKGTADVDNTPLAVGKPYSTVDNHPSFDALHILR